MEKTKEETNQKTKTADPDTKTSAPQTIAETEATNSIVDQIPTLNEEETETETESSNPNEETVPENEIKKNSKFLIITVALIALITGIIIGGLAIYFRSTFGFNKQPQTKEDLTTQTNKQTSPPDASSSATEAPVDLSKYNIGVLNGSEIVGGAGKMKDLLTKEGFNVSSAGNATNSAFTRTVIRTKSSVDASFLKRLTDFLLKTQKLSDKEQLADTEKTDVIIIVGAQ